MPVNRDHAPVCRFATSAVAVVVPSCGCDTIMMPSEGHLAISQGRDSTSARACQ